MKWFYRHPFASGFGLIGTLCLASSIAILAYAVEPKDMERAVQSLLAMGVLFTAFAGVLLAGLTRSQARARAREEFENWCAHSHFQSPGPHADRIIERREHEIYASYGLKP